jgi:16S rRNA (uracil1498-N3)-methyltransferase
MSNPWIHVQALPLAGGGTVPISPEEARHAAGSRRLRDGDAVTVFDGNGSVAVARFVVGIGGAAHAHFTAVERRTPCTPRVEIASAVPKGDRLATLLESIAPLAVATWTPLDCCHSVVRFSDALAQRSWRVLVAACKQSRQPFVPQVSSARSVADCCDDARRRSLSILLAHPQAEANGAPSAAEDAASAAAVACEGAGVVVLIGPEGGFSADEVNAAHARGARRLVLGKSILRIELAASCAAAILRLGATPRSAAQAEKK